MPEQEQDTLDELEPSEEPRRTWMRGSIFGWAWEIQGPQAIILAVIIVYAGFVTWTLYESTREFQIAISDQTIHITKEHERMNLEWRQDHSAIVGGIDALRNSIDENVYVQTLTPQERKDLKLEMPDSLRHKLGKE